MKQRGWGRIINVSSIWPARRANASLRDDEDGARDAPVALERWTGHYLLAFARDRRNADPRPPSQMMAASSMTRGRRRGS
jgi:hypothetical protein